MRLRFLLLWLSPLILASVLVGFLTARAMHARETETYWNQTIEDRVRGLVGRTYVDEITDVRGRELFFAAMEGYLQALDPYCAFYDPEEKQAMEEDTSGQFGGVGILVRPLDAEKTVVGIRRDDPAHREGVVLGDVIVGVDGTDVTDLELSDVTPLIRGRPGSRVILRMRRGEAELDFPLVRSKIKIDSVVGVRVADEEHGVGYLRVTSFQENTGVDAGAALELLRSRGARSFVLDLRQNTGGVLERGAVALVDLFLSDGPIVQTRGRSSSSRRVYQASEKTTVCADEPLVVLVDGGSASAAEVVAGAFQDRRRGILVGTRTYGKFLVQSIHRLPELDVALQLTTARYYTPYGRWLQRNDKTGVRGGLLPDVVVERTQEETDILARDVFPPMHGLDMIVADEEPVAQDDPQLDRALRILTDYDSIRGPSDEED